jgi:hypothetical protein
VVRDEVLHERLRRERREFGIAPRCRKSTGEARMLELLGDG